MNTLRSKSSFVLAGFAILVTLAPWAAQAQSGGRKPVPRDTNVESIREKYWAKGDDSQLGVVQDRLYTKKYRVEVQGFGATISSDPFLSVKSLGASVGFHFSELLALNVLGWKTSVSASDAQDRLKSDVVTGAPTAVNTNEPRSFWGSELEYSPLYGKLSLAGSAIIYYDAHLLGGAGMTGTESGNYFTPFAGIGQQIYLTRYAAIRMDYRLMYYQEKMVEKVRPATLGQVNGTRNTWSNTLSLGLSLLIGG